MPNPSVRGRVEDCTNLQIATNLERLAARDFHQSSTEYQMLRDAARRLQRGHKFGA